MYPTKLVLNCWAPQEQPNFALNCWAPPHREEEPSKNRRMLLGAAGTRYSLVKGERIVRSVPTAQLRASLVELLALLNTSAPCCHWLQQAVWH